ncbi:TetR/AcrR family transcriptional regulator [Planobispora longispora]|uniref:TetR family transcriptional regulator n=1 Tax=Planobispora longispora TaxID=28887 RepID=A0A8J3RR91_9ACTN|nr:TetR/AcrR family transcriptional regulator [Planobispora longispora]BFE83134.1 TetR/AcrR family transcriptional regulator [Planobispora longispora]GIH81446.1 TetR family transcriptional regulator [Planobispora longispora]
MPTGVALRDARQQLFDAAERVLLRDGANGLTSRAVTEEAGVAKGVLHRHFEDFDDFLVELVRERVARLDGASADLRGSAGTGTVPGHLTAALIQLFDPVTVAIVSLIIFRDELRTRLRQARPAPGIPVLTQAAGMISAYLRDECEMGRIAADADVDALALSLVGGAHLLFADREAGPPDSAAVGEVVNAVIADVVQRRLL